MHDFGCKESKDIYYLELEKGVKYFKEEEGERLCVKPLKSMLTERC